MSFLTGLIAVFIGATQKLNGNVNYHVAIGAGMVIELIAIAFFIFHNYQRLKLFVINLMRI